MPIILKISAPDQELLYIGLFKDGQELDAVDIKEKNQQAELLLPELDKLMANNKIKAADLEKIEVDSQGQSFSALRISIAAANALAYAWGIPISDYSGQNHQTKDNLCLVKPKYNRMPNITKEKKKIL